MKRKCHPRRTFTEPGQRRDCEVGNAIDPYQNGDRNWSWDHRWRGSVTCQNCGKTLAQIIELDHPSRHVPLNTYDDKREARRCFDYLTSVQRLHYEYEPDAKRIVIKDYRDGMRWEFVRDASGIQRAEVYSL